MPGYTENYASTFYNSTIMPNDYRQLGQTILGETTSDSSGYITSMNQNGDIVAIGAPANDGGGEDSGHVRVYKYINNTWIQLGQDIDGEAALDGFGRRLDINATGDIVAIGGRENDDAGNSTGHVRVYQYINNTWTQLGLDIDGVNQQDRLGWSVSINSAGDRVAIGAFGEYGNDGLSDNHGHVKVFSYANNTWTQLGQVLEGVNAAADQFGYDVSMNGAGDRIAIFARDRPTDRGNVRIYSLNNNTWTQLGQDILGEATSEFAGLSLELNASGDKIVIGAFGSNANGDFSGQVRVYYINYSNNTWTQLGQDINGLAAGHQFGQTVSMNDSGNRIVAAAGGGVGNVRVFSYSNNIWTQLSDDIYRGWSPDMNGAGDRIAIGDAGEGYGATRVYQI
jgi:hypothetical protein